MTELHIPTLRRMAKKQLFETGQIDQEMLDIIIEDWDLDLAPWENLEQAKDAFHHLMEIYLLSPKVYYKTAGYIKGTRDATVTMAKEAAKDRSPGNDIPDIVA